MAHSDDFILLHMDFGGSPRIPIAALGLDWPPPEFIVFDGESLREATETDDQDGMFHRERYSAITDEQMEGLENRVMRGAEYKYVRSLEERENAQSH